MGDQGLSGFWLLSRSNGDGSQTRGSRSLAQLAEAAESSFVGRATWFVSCIHATGSSRASGSVAVTLSSMTSALYCSVGGAETCPYPVTFPLGERTTQSPTFCCVSRDEMGGCRIVGDSSVDNASIGDSTRSWSGRSSSTQRVARNK